MSTGAEARAQRAWFGWADAPKLSLADIAAMLWAGRVLVLAVGGAICALGLVAALMAPKSYTARSELLVRLGEENLLVVCRNRLRVRPGDAVQIKPDPAQIHLFDRDTGERLEPGM